MRRLIAFGCSNTYGQALSDCQAGQDPTLPTGHLLPGPRPSQKAWPSMAARYLGVDCVNNSKPGASNISIAMSIMAHAWKPGDVALVLWTYVHRETIFAKDKERMVHPYMATHDRIAAAYYTCHDDRDLMLRTWMYQDLAALHLTTCAVPYVMSSIADWPRYDYPGRDHRQISCEHFDRDWIDLADDLLHPGPVQHAEWAQLFADELNKG